MYKIYGVDLDTLAVEVTKLSLLLKVLEDQNKDVVEQQQKLFHERVLPNLSSNIKNGNSLIGTDIQQQGLSLEELKEIKPFDYEDEYQEIFEQGGFDVVIGNPPYVRQESIKEQKPYYKEHYSCYTGVADLYVYFIEKSLNLLKEDGVYSVICSSKFSKAKYGEKIRKYIIDNYDINLFEDYSAETLFEGATTYPCIIKITNNKSENNEIFVDKSFKMKQTRLSKESWVFKEEHILKIKDKIIEIGKPLKDQNNVRINRGFTTGLNDAFMIDESTKNKLIVEDEKVKDIIKPVLRGRNIKQYEINWENKYLLYIPWEFKINDYPSVKNYLLTYRDELKNRPEVVKQKRYPWYSLSRYASDYYEDFEKPKLVYPSMSKKLLAVYDEDNYYLLNSAFIINVVDDNKIFLKSLSAIISSNVLDFYMKLIMDVLQGATYSLKKIYMEQLPIVTIDESVQLSLSEKVDEMLILNRQLRSANTPSEHKLIQQRIDFLDHEINHLVYDLYGLTKEEIEIIEHNL